MIVLKKMKLIGFHKLERVAVLGIWTVAGMMVPTLSGAERLTPTPQNGADDAGDGMVRKVLVEEFTGTACGWCPRGMVGMSLMREQYADRVVPIALHWYNASDVMYLDRGCYYPLAFTSAPSCMLNRGDAIDPKYGAGGEVGSSILDDLAEELARPATASVTVAGRWNADKTEVTATAVVRSLYDRACLRVEFVLVADGLGGITSSWRQANNYASHTAEEIGDPDMAPFCMGGEYGSSAVAAKGLFNDVAIAGSFADGENLVAPLYDVRADEPCEVSFTLSMPAKALLRNSISDDRVSVAAILTDGVTGAVENADIAGVRSEELGVRSAAWGVQGDDCFDLGGRRIVHERARGIHIKKGKKLVE